MDGVLIDSNSVIERGWREAAETFGKTISQDDIIKHIHGQPGPHTIQALFSDLPVEAQRKIQAHIIYVENTAEYDPIPGVAALITSLDSVGIRVGIVTSGWREKIDRVTAMLGKVRTSP
nr:HAD family phosphatase [Enterobacter hormaechei]